MKHSGSDYEGKLESIPSAAARKRIEELEEQVPKLRGRLLPYQLDCVYLFRFQTWTMIAILGGVSLLGLWPITLALRRTLNPTAHPVLRKLQSLGNPEEIRTSIDEEIAEGPVVWIRRVLFTRSWMVSHEFLSLQVARLDDVVWVYKVEIRVHGIKTGVQATVRTRRKQSFGVAGTEKQVDEALELLQAQAPWALFGYDPSVDMTWGNNPDMVIQAVEERRRRYLADPGASGAPPTEDAPPSAR